MIPKYRAFYKPNEKMYKVLTLDIIDEKALIENTDNPDKPLSGYAKWGEMELMQSTGLRDKNGKEIFDGDLVKYEAFDQNIYICKVRFNDYKLQWEMYNIHPTDLECSTNKNNFSRCEIIGNRFDNPELMKK